MRDRCANAQEQSRSAHNMKQRTAAKAKMPLLQAEVSEWPRQFSSSPGEASQAGKPVARPQQERSDSCDKDSPFPPGYGEDLLKEWKAFGRVGANLMAARSVMRRRARLRPGAVSGYLEATCGQISGPGKNAEKLCQAL